MRIDDARCAWAEVPEEEALIRNINMDKPGARRPRKDLHVGRLPTNEGDASALPFSFVFRPKPGLCFKTPRIMALVSPSTHIGERILVLKAAGPAGSVLSALRRARGGQESLISSWNNKRKLKLRIEIFAHVQYLALSLSLEREFFALNEKR
ncbi:hypothetical protein KM043_015016 [Ampulex compressa]|nr:hypothetical protein KM043_015016 [Ampulex compressa]